MAVVEALEVSGVGAIAFRIPYNIEGVVWAALGGFAAYINFLARIDRFMFGADATSARPDAVTKCLKLNRARELPDRNPSR